MSKRATWFVLSLMIVVAFATVAQGEEDCPLTYIGAEKCKMCHKVQHASWLETKHAKATENAKGSEKFDAAVCLGCHATNADETLAGVQCEACHGPGSAYKKMSIMKDREKAMANGLVIPSQETCDGCHTGEDHAAKKVLADELDNRNAIHEFKAQK